MTAITFPLKRFPGQTMNDSIHFGGLMFLQPLVMLITTPAPLFLLLKLSTSAAKVYGLIAILPLIWGYNSMIRYIFTENQEGGLYLLSLRGLRERFVKTRKFLVSKTVESIILSIVSFIAGLHFWVLYESSSILMISLASTISLQSLLSSFPKGVFSGKKVISTIGQVIAFELFLYILTNKSLFLPAIIYFFFNLQLMKTCLDEIEGYALKELLVKVVS